MLREHSMPSVIVIGGGISGLAIAYRLEQIAPAVDVTVLEQRDRIGGTVWTEQRDGFRIETGPNGFLDTKTSTLDLGRELGLGDQLVTASEAAGKNRYLFLGDRLRKLPYSFLSFLRTDLLSWRGKLDLLAERFRPPRRDTGDESIDAFARRRAGRETAEVFADALVTGIYAGDPALLSVRATFPRVVELEERHGSVLKGVGATARQRRREAQAQGKPYQRPGRLWSFRGGLRLLVEALRDRLRRPPLLGVSVRRVERGERGWDVLSPGQERRTADAVVLACPAYEQAAVLADLDAELAERIAGIAYNRVTVVGLGYRAADVPVPLDGFGYLAPQRLRRDLLGVQWCSSTYPDRAPPGTVLLRAMCGGWHRPDIASWDDARLLEAVRAELRLALGVSAPPLLHHIVRWDRAIPQYHLGHLERVASIQERASRHPGLFLAGNAYHGVALNDCTEQGGRVAAQVGGFLS
jgi:oxygen-dependent protoporphyrinogen oxidase